MKHHHLIDDSPLSLYNDNSPNNDNSPDMLMVQYVCWFPNLKFSIYVDSNHHSRFELLWVSNFCDLPIPNKHGIIPAIEDPVPWSFLPNPVDGSEIRLSSWHFNPSEKYARQIGSFPQIRMNLPESSRGVKFVPLNHQIFELPPPSISDSPPEFDRVSPHLDWIHGVAGVHSGAGRRWLASMMGWMRNDPYVRLWEKGEHIPSKHCPWIRWMSGHLPFPSANFSWCPGPLGNTALRGKSDIRNHAALRGKSDIRNLQGLIERKVP